VRLIPGARVILSSFFQSIEDVVMKILQDVIVYVNGWVSWTGPFCGWPRILVGFCIRLSCFDYNVGNS